MVEATITSLRTVRESEKLSQARLAMFAGADCVCRNASLAATDTSLACFSNTKSWPIRMIA
jgi:hypothetical protein